MKKIISFVLVVSMLLSCFIQVSAADTTDIYVSVSGSDENSGTKDQPVASLAKA